MWRNLSDRLGKVRPAWLLLGVVVLAAGLRLWRLDVLPPGLFYDEAYNGFDARQVLDGVHRPLFFAANNGREPLFIYLQALSVAVLGATPFALRVTSALIGIVTIPVIYFCAYTILRTWPPTADEDRKAGWLALVAAAGTAISYWHLSLSRLGFRANLLIPLSALVIAFFWRAWTQQRYRDYIWAGVWLALSMYTYIAARVLPLVILAFVVVEAAMGLWSYRARRRELWQLWRPRLKGLALLTAVTVLGGLPLAWTLVNDPTLISTRTSQVSIWAALPADKPVALLEALLANLVTVARAFYDQGDLNLRHNLPGRSVNDPLLALLFTVGWISALWQIRKAHYRLLLIWFAVMLAPSVLSTEAPHYLRSAGALPPLAIFYAVGAATTVNLLHRAWSRRSASSVRSSSSALPLVIVALLMVAFSGAMTTVDYFQHWARLPHLGTDFDVDRQLAAAATARLLENPAAEQAVVMSADLYSLPQVGFVLGTMALSNPDSAVETGTGGLRMLQEDHFDPRRSLILLRREDGQPVRTWLQPLQPEDLQAAAPMGVLQWPAHQPGWPQLTQVMLPADTTLETRRIRYPLDVTFANGLHLVGYDVEPDELEPGRDNVRIALFWRIKPAEDGQQAVAIRDFDVFVNLNAGGAIVQTNNAPLTYVPPVSSSQEEAPASEEVRVFTPPLETPLGRAHFEVGLYLYRPGGAQDTFDRISILDEQGQAVADRVDLGAVWIGAAPPPVAVDDLADLGVQFGNRIELMGARPVIDPDDPQQLLVELAWKAVDRSTTDYTAFVHLLDESGQQIVAQHDAPPGGSGNPTSLWVPGETVRSAFPLVLPDGIALSDTTLRVGLYEPVSGGQLPVTAPGASTTYTPDGTYVLIAMKQLLEDAP
jgi:hypothetical protein